MKRLFDKKIGDVRIWIPLLCVISFFIGFEVRLFAQGESISPPLREGMMGLIDPLLDCRQPQQAPELNTLKETILDQHEPATDFSVYFRDLDSGAWMGINETQVYYPASLLKLPVLIAYLRLAETDPNILKKEIMYTPAMESNNALIQDYNANSSLAVGGTYQVEDLLHRMVAYSDNRSYLALIDTLDMNYLNSVAGDLGLAVAGSPPPSQNSYAISARAYSFIFRVLYNATYLSPAMSQKALELLSQSDFRGGIVGGLPASSSIPVAHKFGIAITDSTSTSELHDCGIVYYPGRPYALCVMTRGGSEADLEKTISDVSGITYNGVAEDGD